ncbi:MAG TPA: serine hydrolase, partial [Elusimicrobiota bacterium]|nr:serine hydrolase [Elusimicrobiota bacterium]
ARAHTRLLAKKGLEPAAPILSRRWNVVAPVKPARVRIASRTSRARRASAAASIAAVSRAPAPVPAAAPPSVAASPAPAAAPAVPAAKVSAPAAAAAAASVSAVAAAAPPARAAAKPADDPRTAPDTTLQDAIAAFVKAMRHRGLVQRDERTAWSVYDISRDVELAGINQDQPLQTASLIKPFIALAFFDAVAAGEKTYTPEAKTRLEAMIQDSSNADADWFLRELGGPAAVQRRLKKNHGDILRDLSLVEYIPTSGRTYRNKASVHDYTRFLHELWADALPSSAEIKRVMHLPKRNRLLDGAREVPGDTLLYDKTGSTSRLCGDMGILVARGRDGRSYPYILVGVIEKHGAARHYMSWIHRRGDIIRQVSNMAYKAIAARYGLADGTLSASAR